MAFSLILKNGNLIALCLPISRKDYTKNLYNIRLMLNQKSIKAVNAAKFSSHFVKPLSESYCFANIPDTIKSLLLAPNQKPLPQDVLPKKSSRKVVFLFIDSFGWEFWQKHHSKYPFLKRFLTQGVVSKLTSQFPSTTSAHVTTIHTGLPIGQSGLFEWFYYEPKVDAIIAPLLFSFAGKKERDTLQLADIKPKEIYPKKTIYKDLAKHKVKSYIFQYKDYTPSAFSDVVFQGATQVFPYRSLAHGLTLMSQTILNSTGPAYYFYYYDAVDTSGHVEGPSSLVHQAEIHNLFTALEALFYQSVKSEKNLTILLSADHGMTKVSPDKTFYLNKKIKNIDQYLQTNRKKQLLVPAGSCRDMFVYSKEAALPILKKILQQKLQGKAEIYEIRDLIEQGLFGQKVDKQLKDRLSNLVILPYAGQAVWWYEKDKFEQKYFGHHGGLTPEEMHIPFLAL